MHIDWFMLQNIFDTLSNTQICSFLTNALISISLTDLFSKCKSFLTMQIKWLAILLWTFLHIQIIIIFTHCHHKILLILIISRERQKHIIIIYFNSLILCAVVVACLLSTGIVWNILRHIAIIFRTMCILFFIFF